jgi:4-hydroxybenzoate polyprenyltransferase
MHPPADRQRLLPDLLGLLRVDQWLKNGFLFLPAFFAGELTRPGGLIPLLLGIGFFSLTASSVYIFNDLCDLADDRSHPVKRGRPLAAGRFPRGTAIAILVLFLAIGTAGAWMLHPGFFRILLAYMLLNAAYSLGLKQVPLLDITCIAVGFLLRLHAGGALSSVPLSMWIEIMTFLLALFIALAKRRDDVALGLQGHPVRKSAAGYSLEMVQASMVLVGGVMVVTYIQYTIAPDVVARVGTDRLYYSSALVLLGMLRYFQLALVHQRTGTPTRLLLTDIPLQLIVGAWLGAFAIVLYAR